MQFSTFYAGVDLNLKEGVCEYENNHGLKHNLSEANQ